jgi:hypothetical protein
MRHAAAMTHQHAALSHLTGLDGFWEMHTHRRSMAARPGMADPMLLDALGLGLEQTIGWLGTTRPDWPAFLAWIIETAGPPDPIRLARYEATLAAAPLPSAVQAELAAIDAMDAVLGPAELAQWDRDGYVVLRDAIPPEATCAAAKVVWDANNARREDPESWYAPRPQGIMVQLFQHPALEPVRRSPRVHKAFAQLWGTSDLWSTVDRVGFNPPERAGHPFRAPRLHWDVSLVQPIPFATQGILYLTDTAEDGGALELVPGFHHRIGAWLDGIGDADPRTIDLSAEAIRVAARAGDLVIWRQDLPHGASPNRAGHPRLVQYITMYSPRLTQQPVWR